MTVSKATPEEIDEFLTTHINWSTDDGKLQPMELKKGDNVLFEKYAGSKIKLDGIEYLIIKEDDILGILEN